MDNVVQFKTKTLSRSELLAALKERVEMLQDIVDMMEEDAEALHSGHDLTIRGSLDYPDRFTEDLGDVVIGCGQFGRLTIEYSFDYMRKIVIDNQR